MRVLVTNDDGVSAPGLRVAEEIAETIARENDGPGEVWVVAPAFEQSGVSHAITFTEPVKIERLGPRRFACAGTPADCVILAVHALMAETPPDLVISGVNRGHNLAEDAIYSGTVGGAIEGALQGVRAVALSQYFNSAAMRAMLERSGRIAGPIEATEIDAMFASSRAHGVAAVQRLLALDWTKDLFFNVNFPPVPPEDVKGLTFTPQGRRTSGEFSPVARVSPGGRPYYWMQHRIDNRSGAPEDDQVRCSDGWVTMTPMSPDLTDRALLARLVETP